jgi:hypothetical protein
MHSTITRHTSFSVILLVVASHFLLIRAMKVEAHSKKRALNGVLVDPVQKMKILMHCQKTRLGINYRGLLSPNNNGENICKK